MFFYSPVCFLSPHFNDEDIAFNSAMNITFNSAMNSFADRRERQAGECSLTERRNAFFFIYSSAFMTSVPLDNRDHFCM